MTLDEAREGHSYRILALPGQGVRAQAIRFGINEGERITCSGVIPRGPVIVAKNRQEIAIGRGLARKIIIEPDTHGAILKPKPKGRYEQRRAFGNG